VLNIGDRVEATVLGVDLERHRISLSLDETKGSDVAMPPSEPMPQPSPGEAREKSMGSFGALLSETIKKGRST
jgi:small subunit ribosomal protein S1